MDPSWQKRRRSHLNESTITSIRICLLYVEQSQQGRYWYWKWHCFTIIQQWVNLTMVAIKPFPTQRNRKPISFYAFTELSECLDFLCVYFADFGQSIEYDKHRINYLYIIHIYGMLTSITFHIFIHHSKCTTRFHCVQCTVLVLVDDGFHLFGNCIGFSNI